MSLKRRSRSHELLRQEEYSIPDDLVPFFQHELNRSGHLHGYRWFPLKCLQNNFVVTQQMVRQLLPCLDPQGVEIRKLKRLKRRQYAKEGPIIYVTLIRTIN